MTFTITTAIDYVNAKPHIGHAYEKIAADVIARWHRLKGDEVFFLTGTDENAQKNAQAARAAGMETQAFVDRMAAEFQRLCAVYAISNDAFVRTTEKRHAAVAQKVFQALYDQGDIYKGTYAGLYCEGCEAFYVEKDLANGACPEHKKPLSWIEEENYFFRLSTYRRQIADHIRKTDFIWPPARRQEILNRLAEPLRDLSVSRYGVQWGIPVPFDDRHRIYVWFDALLNYISALDYPGARYKRFWPADLHVVGVGITWFHVVIWPAMLLAAGLPLPKRVVVHGYVTTGGEKMSKSLGNVADPLELAERYPIDAIRYFLLREIPFGEDGDFSEAALKRRLNGELLADLGNLVSRVLALWESKPGVVISGKADLEKKLNLHKIAAHMQALELHHALAEIFRFVGACNAYINETEPWKKSGKDVGTILYNLLESLRVICILLSPFLPTTAEAMSRQLGVRLGKLKDARFGPFRGTPTRGQHLFTRVQ